MTHRERLTKLAEATVPHILKAQVLDKGSRYYGGITEAIKGFPDPMSTAGYMDQLLSLYYCPDSIYYHDASLLDHISAMMDHLLAWQHEDGTIDFLEVDFFSVPSLAFTVQVLVPLARLIDKHIAPAKAAAANSHADNVDNTQTINKINVIKSKITQFLLKATYAMPRGGFNTPNHRWVVASAESLCASYFGDKGCLDDCNLYLQEGIDCDEDGEFTERSVGIYDAVNDNAMIIMANELGRSDLLEHVRRNLNKLQKYVEPDDTVMTLNSRRQDVGRAVYPKNMYWTYRYMAVKDQNPLYAHMADKLLAIWENMQNPLGNAQKRYEPIGLVAALKQFLLDDALNADPPAGIWTNTYRAFFPKSGIVRERQEDCSFTLVADKPIFLKVQNGNLCVYGKLHASLTGFGAGRFIADTLETVSDNAFRMTHKATLPYSRPLPNPGAWDYNKMPNEKREKVGHQTLTFDVCATLLERAVELRIKLDCVEYVPWKLELLFDPGGIWETGDSWVSGSAGSWTILKRGGAVYMKDGDKLEISGGIGLQRYAPYARSSEDPDADKFNVYLSGFAPIDHVVRIACL